MCVPYISLKNILFRVRNMKARKRRIKYWAYKSQIAQGLVIIIICMAIIIIMVFSSQLQVSFARRPQQWLCLRLERKWELRPKVISSQKHNHIRKALYPHNHNKSHHHHYHLIVRDAKRNKNSRDTFFGQKNISAKKWPKNYPK